jgi:ribosomal protein S18 acetylase RimI-like enzyme
MGLVMARESVIREATPQDLDALLELELAGFDRDAFRLSQLRYLLLTRANATTFILEEMGEIQGAAIMLWRRNSSVGRLYSIVVYSLFRGVVWGAGY